MALLYRPFGFPTAIVEDKPDPALKGKLNGNCNVTACQRPHAHWYNTVTQAYYCQHCALKINRANPEIQPPMLYQILGPVGRRRG